MKKRFFSKLLVVAAIAVAVRFAGVFCSARVAVCRILHVGVVFVGPALHKLAGRQAVERVATIVAFAVTRVAGVAMQPQPLDLVGLDDATLAGTDSERMQFVDRKETATHVAFELHVVSAVVVVVTIGERRRQFARRDRRAVALAVFAVN